MTEELVGPIRHGPLDPAAIEEDVVRLRGECAALLRELETRVMHVVQFPARVKARVVDVEKAALAWARRNRTTLISVGVAAGVLLLAGGITGWARARRAERQIFSLRRLRSRTNELRRWLARHIAP